MFSIDCDRFVSIRNGSGTMLGAYDVYSSICALPCGFATGGTKFVSTRLVHDQTETTCWMGRDSPLSFAIGSEKSDRESER